jgi:hypothetical protein
VEEVRAIVATSRRLLDQRLDRAQRAPSGCADIAGARRPGHAPIPPMADLGSWRTRLTGTGGGHPDHE